MSVSLQDEVRSAALGDQRQTKRLCKVIEELGAKPNMSVPAATHGRAEMEAAYRFFDNDKVSSERILQPHIDATRERVSQAEVVLLVQDTTDLDLTRPHQQVRGAGPMEYETRRGAFFHPLLAFNDHGLPLGVAWQKSWTRSQIKKMTKNEKGRWLREKPIEGKETFRWIGHRLEGYVFIPPGARVPRTQLRVDLRTERMEIGLDDRSQSGSAVQSTVIERDDPDHCLTRRICHPQIDTAWNANVMVRSAASSRPVYRVGSLRPRLIFFFCRGVVWNDE